MVSVLLTRPQTTSAQLAKELQRQGYETIIEPLLTIAPTDTSRPAGDVQAVMITSANALAALEENSENVGDLLNLPCFCVGFRTAGSASAFGFRRVIHSNSDGAELAQLAAKSLTDINKAVLHIAGTHTDSKARTELQRLGFDLSLWPVYSATPASSLTPQITERLKNQRLDAMLLFSPRSAETLQHLITRYKLEACCQSMIAIGLSEAVTAKLKSLPWRQLIAAPRPTEDAVIACLKDILPLS